MSTTAMATITENKLESTFLKVNRRGKLMNRRLIIDQSNKILEYHRYRKKLTIRKKIIYHIQDISDLREGWKTNKFKKIEEKEQRLWLKGKQSGNNWVREECSFSIILGPSKTIDLIAADSIERECWLNKLRVIMFEAKTDKKTRDRRTFIEKCFKEADKNGDKCIDFLEAMSILNRLNISISHDLAKELFQKSIVVSKVVGGEEALDMDEFITFFESLENRWEVEELFRKYAKPGGTIMGPDELKQFLKIEQSQDVSVESCQRLIERFQTSWYASLSTHLLEASQRNPASAEILELYMNSKGFETMLLSPDFDLFNHDHYKLNQDMKKPLNHYYIQSSHNTYLLAGQLAGDSSIEGYIEALRRGYRCIELDIWDGDEDDGPIVYHGYTMVSKLLLKDVLEAIGAYAFDATPYPLILSLEINCSHEQQKSIATLLVAILGDKLYKRPILPNERTLPSPEMLKNKILIKAKGHQPKNELDMSSSSDSDEEELNETRRYITDRRYSMPAQFHNRTTGKANKGLVNNLADLAIYCSTRKFRTLEDTLTWQFNEMFSLNETESADLANFYTRQYIACTAKRLVRIYPKGSRINSSNYDPTIHWNVGCQMVALNVQTLGKHLLINEAKFASNGRCGYSLKPAYLVRPAKLKENLIKLLSFELTVISGQQLPKVAATAEDDIVDPYVKISVIGHQEDRRKMTTKVVKNNGFNPIWSETFVFTIKYPELAFLYFKVKDERLSGKDGKLAGNVIAVSSMRSGYRHFQLLDSRAKKIDGCTLFLKVKIS